MALEVDQLTVRSVLTCEVGNSVLHAEIQPSTACYTVYAFFSIYV